MRMIKVESCRSCPKKIHLDIENAKFWCTISLRVIILKEDDDSIPEWCELDEIVGSNNDQT